MKRTGWIAAMILAVLLCLFLSASAGAENGAEPDEWTVMFYFCGADLESRYGYASENLQDICRVYFPYDYSVPGAGSVRNPGKVNILVETGGSRQWHAQDIGMDISAESLQRWQYHYHDPENVLDNNDFYAFSLVDTLPLRSMADPETLADFIRWGAREYPAEKYALVLWGHGNGAKTGLFIDELFGGDMMCLYELKQALADGGVFLDDVIIDACLMANIETAWSVRDSARWMVASEENVPGKGTAIHGWLQALVNYPALDGEWLGRCVCDMTGIKYANEPDDMARSLLTWSLTDLSRVDRLIDISGRVFRVVGSAIRDNPPLMRTFTQCISATEEYGDGLQNMRDLGSLIYNETLAHYVDTDLMEELIGALSDAVVYISRGPGRSEARGLSICFPVGFSDEELDVYARNFPMPSYLSYLDAITPWTAPDWVYGQTEKLPEIDEIEKTQVTAEKRMADNGLPALVFGENDWFINETYYNLYHLDAATGEIVRLGRTDCGVEVNDNLEFLTRASDPMHWPSVNGTLCCIDLIKNSGDIRLYNIPVQINSDIAILRCGRSVYYTDDGTTRQSDYETYGLWEGYDENSSLMNRSVMPLAMMAGRKYRLLYPLADPGRDSDAPYLTGGDMTMERALHVTEIPLPAGTYYLEYEITDLFRRVARLEKIELCWDGTSFSFPDGFSWEGSFRVVFSRP